MSYSWLSRWSLWDIFLVLIIAVASFRMFGIPLALLSLVSLLFMYHRQDAPVIIWLNILAVTALLSVASGKLQPWLRAYQGLSFAVLILMLIPFSMQQIRDAMYPQLEQQMAIYSPVAKQSMPAKKIRVAGQGQGVQDEEMLVASPDERELQRPMSSAVRSGTEKLGSAVEYDRSRRDSFAYDPKAMIQTGPGVPAWQWKTVSLGWSGPVDRAQKLDLYLVPPWLNRIANVFSVLLALAFAALLWLRAKPKLTGFKPLNAAAVMFLGVFFASPDSVYADVMIDSELLKTLEHRLTQPAECLPDCASISTVELSASEQGLEVSLEAQSQDSIAFPLPAWRQHWLPESVAVNGQPATLTLAESGQLLVKLSEGSHRVTLKGNIIRNQLDLRFGLPVHHLTYSLDGWTLEGVNRGSAISGSLQLQRINRKEGVKTHLLADPVPPFVRVVRHLEFALDWRVRTIVERIAPGQGAINLNLDLLPGESPTTDIAVSDGKVNLAFAPHQATVRWESVLEKSNPLNLTAQDNLNITQVWHVSVSPVWHFDYSGIPPIKQDGTGVHQPHWRPWAGEQLELRLERAEGKRGDTLTIDKANVIHRVGSRINMTEIELKVRTSRGQIYPFQLPTGATLDSLSVNGKSQPLINTQGLIEIPLRPGAQKLNLSWREEAKSKFIHRIPELDFDHSVSNIQTSIRLPRDRWTLLTGGPLMGPAVLVWSLVIVFLAGALVLARVPALPLKFHQWFFLALGLGSTTWFSPVIIVVWFALFALRGQLSAIPEKPRFQLLQVFLAAMTFVTALTLLFAIPMGLLSMPDMLVAGNGSSAYDLRWYQDRLGDGVEPGWVLSLPLFVYRLAMLVWSLWLAVALLSWVKWGWRQYAHRALWTPAARNDNENNSAPVV